MGLHTNYEKVGQDLGLLWQNQHQCDFSIELIDAEGAVVCRRMIHKHFMMVRWPWFANVIRWGGREIQEGL